MSLTLTCRSYLRTRASVSFGDDLGNLSGSQAIDKYFGSWIENAHLMFSEPQMCYVTAGDVFASGLVKKTASSWFRCCITSYKRGRHAPKMTTLLAQAFSHAMHSSHMNDSSFSSYESLGIDRYMFAAYDWTIWSEVKSIPPFNFNDFLNLGKHETFVVLTCESIANGDMISATQRSKEFENLLKDKGATLRVSYELSDDTERTPGFISRTADRCCIYEFQSKLAFTNMWDSADFQVALACQIATRYWTVWMPVVVATEPSCTSAFKLACPHLRVNHNPNRTLNRFMVPLRELCTPEQFNAASFSESHHIPYTPLSSMFLVLALFRKIVSSSCHCVF